MITIQFGERREMPFWWRLQNAHISVAGEWMENVKSWKNFDEVGVHRGKRMVKGDVVVIAYDHMTMYCFPSMLSEVIKMI